MQQNPDYFPGYYTEGRKIDVQVMDRMLLERCKPWIYAENEIDRKAALAEYVDTVIGLIELDGANPRHRYDVQDQALSTINVWVNEQGRNSSLDQNHITRTFMREQFLKGITERLFDRKYENSFHAPNAEIDQRRTQLRDSFQTILNVDPSVLETLSPDISGQPNTTPRISVESPDVEQSPIRIQIEFSDRHQGSTFFQALGKEARKKRWKVYISFTESGASGTVEIYPKKFGRIQKRGEQAVRAALQPIEEYLTANGCIARSIVKDDPRRVARQWHQE